MALNNRRRLICHKKLQINKPVKSVSTKKQSLKNLPLSVSKLIKMMELCTNHCFFKYNSTYYQQKCCLPVGSPLRSVLACLYQECFKSEPSKHILPNVIQYFRNIDDILIIYTKEHNIPSITHKLNHVESSINFPYKLEKNNSLPFLDIFLINNSKLEFKAYH